MVCTGSAARRSRLGSRLFFAILLLLLFGSDGAAVEPTTRPGRPADIDDRRDPGVSGPLREAPEIYVLEEDEFRLELFDEGWMYRLKEPGSRCVVFWLMEIEGTRGQIVWTRDRELLDLRVSDGEVHYRRTPAIVEVYAADRTGVRQIWEIDENPLWEGGGLVIRGEILTTYDVRVEDGKTQLYDGDRWIGPLCSFEARDRSGRILDLEPELERSVLTLRIPSSWLYRAGKERESSAALR
jgi:hypothetical protein